MPEEIKQKSAISIRNKKALNIKNSLNNLNNPVLPQSLYRGVFRPLSNIKDEALTIRKIPHLKCLTGF